MITIDFLSNNKILTSNQKKFIIAFNKKLIKLDTIIENVSNSIEYTRENFEKISKYVIDIQTYLNAEIERQECDEGAEQYQGYSLYLKHRRILFETTFDLEDLRQYFSDEEN
jgi:pantothenate kinase-related protein Tda10